MLKLFSLPAAGKIRSLSPFVWKTEALLKLAGLPFEKEYVSDFSKLPKGKVPALQDGERIIGNSSHIQAYVKEKYGFDPDKNLTAGQKAVATAFRRLAEEHLYWIMVYGRFIDPANKAAMKQAMYAGMAEDEAESAFTAFQAHLQNQMHGHGIGRHSLQEVYAFGKNDLDAVSDYLGDKPFFFGDEITSVDLSLVPVIAGIILSPCDTELSLYARQKANLAAYTERFDAAVYVRRRFCFLKSDYKRSFFSKILQNTFQTA